MMAGGPTLRDIHLPADPSWWPLAPGWWGLAALVLLALVFAAWWRWRRRLPRQRWRQANRELDQLLALHRDDAGQFAAGVSQLLRRAARTREPAAIGLRGEAWHAALERLAMGHADVCALQGLERVIYRPGAELDVAVVALAARQWLRHVLLHGGRRA